MVFLDEPSKFWDTTSKFIKWGRGIVELIFNVLLTQFYAISFDFRFGDALNFTGLFAIYTRNLFFEVLNVEHIYTL